MNKMYYGLMILVFFCLQGTLHAQNKLTKVATVEGITEYTLPNGLRVVLFPDPSKPQVTVNVTYLVGNRHEDYGETGMAHLLEHLVFKGTPDHPDIAKQLKDHGAFYNGTTWFDRTNYFETLTSTEENIEWALKMEADRMVNSYISGEDLTSEMTVVRNEFEMGENNPSGVLMKRVMAASYQWHNYGQTTIGARADLENVPIERLQAFYKEYYQPDNAVLLVVGKFDEAQTMSWIEQYFGAIPKPERVLMETYTREPTQDGERFVTLRRVGDVQALAAMYHICAGAHPDYPAIDVLNEILTAEPAGRLYKAMVDTKKSTNIWGWAAGLKEPGFIYFGADVLKDKSLDDAQTALTEALDTLSRTPFTQEELERAKTALLKNFELSFNDSRRVGVFMSNYIASGDWRLAFLYRDRVKEVSLEDVQRVAATYLKPSNRTIGQFIPEDNPDRAEIPEAPELSTLVDNFVGGEAISEGEVFDPTPDNIEGRVIRTLQPNKPDYVFMPKQTRGDAVQARMTLNFGTKANLKNKSIISSMAASMIDKGTATMSRQQIQDKFDNLKANVRFFGSGASFNVNIETENEYLDDVIALVNDLMKNASFPEEEFNKLKDENLAQIEEQKSQPMAIAQSLLFRHINPYPKDDVRYSATFDEEAEMIKNLSLDDVKAFHKEFYGANNATVSIVGDFAVEEIQQQLNETLADWKSTKPYAKMLPEMFDVTPENINIETPDKANAAFFAGEVFTMQDNHPDYPALMLANYIFGGGALSSRLGDRIRQKDGLSYGVGSFMSVSTDAPKATWGAYAIYAPENVKALEIAFKEELEKAIKDGFTDQEVADAKKGWLQQQQVSRSQDNYLTSTLNSYLDDNRTMMWNKELEEKVSKLSAADISKAFAKYIIPDKISYVKAGDFAKNTIKP